MGNGLHQQVQASMYVILELVMKELNFEIVVLIVGMMVLVGVIVGI